MTRLSPYVFGLAGCMSMTEAAAVPPLLASDLARDCAASAATDAVPERCALYIAGFLDGAVATDVRVAENVIEEIAARESLTERAMRTRVGERMRKLGPSVYAEYCVGDPVPIQDVVELVRRSFSESPPGADSLARDSVFAVLRAHYPCRE